MHSPFLKKILLYALVGALFWLGGRLVLPIALPFLLAAILALAAERAVGFLTQRLHFPRPLATGVGIGGVCVLFGAVTVLLLSGLMRQLPRLETLTPRLEAAVRLGRDVLQTQMTRLSAKFPGSTGAFLQQWTAQLFSRDSQLPDTLLQGIPRLVTGLAEAVSNGLFGLLTALIAAFMLSVRLPQLKNACPEPVRLRLHQVASGLKSALGGWFLAQCKLAGLTFCVLWAGFALLRIRSSLSLAGLIALVDAFPVLGVGTVLLPWSLICFLQGQTARGLGLLGIYGTAWLLRSFLEPKLVGKGLGLDPLVTLIAMYAGFKLWGIGGMLLSPVAVMICMEVKKAWKP